MKSFFLTILTVAILSGCAEGTYPDRVNPEDAAVKKAAEKCAVSVAEMNWLREMIIESENVISKKGNFYAIETSVGTIISHQPMVSSCYACLLYSCDGSVATLSEQVLSNEVVPGMTAENQIHGYM